MIRLLLISLLLAGCSAPAPQSACLGALDAADHYQLLLLQRSVAIVQQRYQEAIDSSVEIEAAAQAYRTLATECRANT